MDTTAAFWFVLVGCLLLGLGMTAPLIKKIPVTTAMIYLAIGVIVGPTGFALFHFNPLQQSGLLEILTEVVVLISLFSAGVKMPVPFRLSLWRAPIQLAFISMAITVALVAMFGYYIMALPLGAAVLLGAIIAPTDPVLATDVQVRHPGDEDSLRFSLTSEAGLNDGSAFPFVMLGLGLLGLHDLGSNGIRWLVIDVAWATAAGLAIGITAGYTLAKVAHYMRKKKVASHELLHDFLGLGLIALVYGVSLMLNTWGFLAVFAAAVALRQTELGLAGIKPESAELQDSGVPLEQEHSVSGASLIFKEHLERLSEVVLILLIGGTLFVDSWSWKAVGFAAFLFLVARPLSVMLGLIGTNLSWRVKNYAAWFGVRGIGSLYYLMFSIQHGLPEPIAMELIHIVLVVVSLSILVHGITVKPMINQYGYRSLNTVEKPC